MQLSDQAQAVLLLTSHFTRSDKGEPRPLSTHEWGKFAYWLKDHGLQPSALISEDPKQLLSSWMDHGITQDRIEYLLGRGGALGLALEKWQRAGLWVLTRSDTEYPDRLKKRLKLEAPPLLFGCGNWGLLSKGGIAVVGSRSASAEDLAFAADFGTMTASEGLSIVSGGARGVDQSAMLGALEHEGTVIGVLADSLLRSATSAKYRRHLMSNDLVLISPFNPEAGFNAGNAMARNRHIYCLADAAVVVAAGRGTGGTWNGATENLKARWVPTWVRPHSDPDSGNADLVRRGASWLPREGLDLPLLLAEQGDGAAAAASQESLPLRAGTPHSENSNASKTLPADDLDPQGRRQPKVQIQDEKACTPKSESLDGVTFYEFFLHQMASLTTESPLNSDDLRQQLDLTRTQLDAWLKRAVVEQRIKKLTKPVRYRWRSHKPAQTSIFDRE